MTDIATHVRIFDANPSDDLVMKRTAAVKDLAGRYNKSRTALQIFQSANDLAAAIAVKGQVSEAMSKEVEAAVRKAGAEAFVAGEQPLQVTVCALLGALQAIEQSTPTTGNTLTPAVFAVGLWSALAFQSARSDAKLEALRTELLGACRSLTIRSATTSRQRANVPDIDVKPPEPFDAAQTAKALNKGASEAIAALRANAAIDREELELLWWVLADWSDLLQQRYSLCQNPAAGAVSSGLEAGQLLRRMPGEAHRNLVLRNVGKTVPMNLAELLRELDEDREKLATPFRGNSTVLACPSVFPLLSALLSGSSAHANTKTKRSISEWAERALLERSALHVTSVLPAVAI